MSWNKLRYQANLIVFAEAENGLSHRVQRGVCPPPPPLIPQIGQSDGIVQEEGDGMAPKNRKEPQNSVKNHKEFPVVDRIPRKFQRPQAGQMVVREKQAPARIRGVGVQGGTWLRKVQRQTDK